MGLDEFPQPCDGEAVEAQDALVRLGLLEGSIRVVRHVDDEAGVAPGCAETGALRLDQDDSVVRDQFREPARRRHAGKSGADHNPIRLLLPC